MMIVNVRTLCMVAVVIVGVILLTRGTEWGLPGGAAFGIMLFIVVVASAFIPKRKEKKQ
jgi:hypothetical protein